MVAAHNSESEKKVAILFANLKGNIGDFAILEAMADIIVKAFPGHRIVAHPHPLVPIDRIRLDEFSRHNPAITIANPTWHMKIGAFHRVLASSPLKRPAQASLIRSFVNKSKPEFARFADYDAIFFAGGDQWSGRELGVAMFGTLAAIHRVNKAVYSFPFSLKSSLLGLYSNADLSRYFSMIQNPLIVRDSLTKDIINGFSQNATLGADCVFSLKHKASLVAPATNRDQKRTLFVVKGREPELASALQKLIALNSNIELLTTCPMEDASTFRKLSAEFGITCHEPKTWQEIVAEFKSSSLIVTNRLHGLILGSLAEIPLLPVTNRKKSLAFVRDAKMPHAAANPSDVSPALIEAALNDRDLILSNMRNYADECRAMPHQPLANIT